jgi:uncharacterized protein YjbI with pentapeptide repeats
MATFTIKNRYSGAVQFQCELSAEAEALGYRFQLGFAVKAAYKGGADLSGADLRVADLRGADLRVADLRGADLSGADLRGADLSGADLRGADLSGADLRGADLSGADLRGADLSGAGLRGADLRGADLRVADLSGADLSGADLRGADLSGADLRGAGLRGAGLRGADLTSVRDDLWAVLASVPKEAVALRQALIDGKVDGSTYSGECACLVGTIANARGCGVDEIPGLVPNSARPIEAFFTAIRPGDTPDKSEVAKLALAWTEEWLSAMRAAFGAVGLKPGR